MSGRAKDPQPEMNSGSRRLSQPFVQRIMTANGSATEMRTMSNNKTPAILMAALAIIISLSLFLPAQPAPAQTQETCEGPFISVAQPLNDLGNSEYIRLEDGPTGFTGGLYPGGSNVRPPEHEAAGLAMAARIQPLNQDGEPSADGRVVMISVGMSNAAMEFRAFIDLANADPERNPSLSIVDGAQAGRVTRDWLDPQADSWEFLDQRLFHEGFTPAQAQVAWVKNVRTGGGEFPAKAQALQEDLAIIVRNLKINYPNIKIAYLSSRTRSYTYWYGLSPEPVAYETGFAVKWLVEQQIGGDPALNFDEARGEVVAPFLSWGPYLWIDGENPRSDGRVWLAEDMVRDCTHPSDSGVQKVAEQLLAFFQTDSTARGWYLADPGPLPTPEPTVEPTPASTLYLPDVEGGDAPQVEGPTHCHLTH